MISLSSVDNETATVLDVFEGLEASMQIADEFGKFISPGLTDMTLIDDENDLDLLVDIQQSLNKEGVGDLVLLSLIILESRAVVECHIFDDHLSWN
jgi:uncharacterized protein YjgD (DUF1641 family)